MSAITRKIKVLYLNAAGAGFGDPVEIPERTTIGEFFRLQMNGASEDGYVIRVNGAAVARDQCLLDGDTVNITTGKQQSA